jgi:hypothetical protein
MTQVTFAPVQVGASICFCRIKQRHEPHALSSVLQSLSTVHERSGAACMLGMPGCDSLGSGALASSSAGAFIPDDPERIAGGAPTWVIPAVPEGF